MQQQDKQIFEGYEIKNWNFSPRLYKILGAAAAFNLLAILVLGQTNLLTRKGCESPLVSSVCQVIDTLYVGSALLGTGGDFVNKDYEKTQLEDADITYIDVSGQEAPLKYPEGYFALANPEGFTATQNVNNDFAMMPSNIPGIPTNPTFSTNLDLMKMPQVTPTPNKNAIKGKIPTTPFDFGVNPIPATPNRSAKFPRIRSPKFPQMNDVSPNKLPKLDGDETAVNKAAVNKAKEKKEKKDNEKQPDKTQTTASSEPVTDFRPNKKPLEEFAGAVVAKRSDAKKKLDLTKSFSVQMIGELDSDGKLIAKKSGYVKTDGDKEMIDVAKDAIEAINDSGMFYYLKNQGIDKVNLTLVQDDKQIYAVITSEQKTEERAKTLSSGFNGLISVAKGLVSEAELKTLLDAAKTEQKGKDFVLNFVIPKPVAQEMIKKKLDEAEAKAKEGKEPNSTAQNSDANLKTSK